MKKIGINWHCGPIETMVMQTFFRLSATFLSDIEVNTRLCGAISQSGIQNVPRGADMKNAGCDRCLSTHS